MGDTPKDIEYFGHSNSSKARTRASRPALWSFLIVPGFALLIAACSPEQPEIRAEDLRYYVETLSDDAYRGRESGTAHAREAAAFIARRYQRAGLTPAFPAGARGSFFQKFDFQGGIEIVEGSYLRPSADDAKSGFRAPRKIVPLPLGYAGQASGDLIFLGFCLEAPGWNDFAGIAPEMLDGKIALCLRHGPGGDQDPRFRRQISFRAKYENLVKRKLAGVVFLGREGFPAPSPSDLGGVSSRKTPAIFVEPQEVFESFGFLEQTENRMRAEERRESGADTEIGRVLAKVEMATRFRERRLPGYNVGAFLRPPTADERVIIVGAHFDHIGNGAFSSLRGKGEIHNGADDNASGTAAVLELALQLKALETDASTDSASPGASEDSAVVAAAAAGEAAASQALTRVPAGVNVLFLHFDAEERGLFGARHFVKSKVLPAQSIAAMINLDMVGRLRPDKGLSVQGEQSADPRWGAIIRRAFADTGFADDIELRMVKGGGGPSDHSAFYSEKIPVAFLFTGGHREYHTSEDDAHLVNIAGLEKITGMTGRIVIGLAAQESAGDAKAQLAYRRAPAEAMRTDFEFRVRLGIMPGDYSRDSGGLEVADVRDDAPVRRTGLRAGDVIVKLGEREIRDIGDYMEFLGDASAQKSYAIEFKRGDQLLRGTTRLIAAP